MFNWSDRLVSEGFKLHNSGFDIRNQLYNETKIVKNAKKNVKNEKTQQKRLKQHAMQNNFVDFEFLQIYFVSRFPPKWPTDKPNDVHEKNPSQAVIIFFFNFFHF